MKAYLINPPPFEGVKMVREGRCMQRLGAWTTVWPPYSVCTAAALFEKAGFCVKVNDCIVEGISYAALKGMIQQFKPRIVVINTATPSIEGDLSVAKMAKDIDPGIITVAIGIHVTELTNECFAMQPCLDIVVRGELEDTITELTKAMASAAPYKGLEPLLRSIKGLSYRTKEGIAHNEKRPFIRDIDKIPYPAWQYINVNNYKIPFLDKPFLLLATARGCPYNCTFCSAKPYYGQGLRLFSVSRVVDEMEYDLKGLGVSEFLIWTESFTLNRDFVMAFCDEILRRRLRVHWACNGRVDNADPEMFRRMKRAGCWNIGFGVESASQEVLDKARKGTTVKQIVNAIKLAKAAGLEVTAHCMVGLPGETRQTIQDTVRLLKELDVGFAQFYCAVPFPWTDLYKIAKANNWIRSYDWRYYEQNYSVMGNECLSPDQVVSLRSRAYKSFFLRPKILLKVLKQIRKPRDIVNLAVMAKDFATWA